MTHALINALIRCLNIHLTICKVRIEIHNGINNNLKSMSSDNRRYDATTIGRGVNARASRGDQVNFASRDYVRKAVGTCVKCKSPDSFLETSELCINCAPPTSSEEILSGRGMGVDSAEAHQHEVEQAREAGLVTNADVPVEKPGQETKTPRLPEGFKVDPNNPKFMINKLPSGKVIRRQIL